MKERNTQVRDLMISLDEYAIVPEEATLLDALYALEVAQSKVGEGGHQHRAVLVRNNQGRIVGKVGHLAFLRALRAAQGELEQDPRLRRAGLDEELIRQSESVYHLFSEDVTTLCGKSRTVRVRNAMHPMSERVREDESLLDALDVFTHAQTLSLLVTREDQAVGVLRLVDLFDEIAETMKNCAEGN